MAVRNPLPQLGGAPTGVPLAMLAFTSIVTAAVVVTAPRLGLPLAVLFSLFWCRETVRTARPTDLTDRRFRVTRASTPARGFGPDLLVIAALQLPWLVWFLAHRMEGHGLLFAVLVVALPVISVLGYRSVARAR